MAINFLLQGLPECSKFAESVVHRGMGRRGAEMAHRCGVAPIAQTYVRQHKDWLCPPM